MPEEKQKPKRGENGINYNQNWGFALVFLMLGLTPLLQLGTLETYLGLHNPIIIFFFVVYFAIPQVVWLLECYWNGASIRSYIIGFVLHGIGTVLYPIFGVLVFFCVSILAGHLG